MKRPVYDMVSSHANFIGFTPEKRDRLRKAYIRAIEMGRDQFEFEGHDFLTAYAQYMLEYLDQQFGDKS